MWALIAEYNDVYQERIGEPFEDHYSEEVVALFSSEERARAYEQASRLAQRQRRSFASDRVYRHRSLLCRAESARIEEWVEPSYPVDPVL